MSKKDIYDKIIGWFDERIGFTKTPLHDVPEYVLNPSYWLGALALAAFLVQGVTGAFQLLYYIPLPANAYNSTMVVIQTVPLGHLIETLHFYGSYAMVGLAFGHLIRNYFGSVYKWRRELMWVVGVLMGITTLGLGITGYLLPWTVVSKSATDVAIGFLGFLPSRLADIAKFLVTGNGSDAAELKRFFDLHTVLLSFVLLFLFALKLYMYEVHLPSHTPTFGDGRSKYLNWFPTVFLYFLMLIGMYSAILIAAASIFPLHLPPEYSPQLASEYVVQPDWYVMWLYQILKFEFFEGPNIPHALYLATGLIILLILLPFYDRSSEKLPSRRPVFTTVGLVILAEFIVLIIWGYLTPGQTIPLLSVIEIVGGTAAVVSVISFLMFRYLINPKKMISSKEVDTKSKEPDNTQNSLNTKLFNKNFTLVIIFMVLLTLSSIVASSLFRMLIFTNINLLSLLASSIILIGMILPMVWIIKYSVKIYEIEVKKIGIVK